MMRADRRGATLREDDTTTAAGGDAEPATSLLDRGGCQVAKPPSDLRIINDELAKSVAGRSARIGDRLEAQRPIIALPGCSWQAARLGAAPACGSRRT